MMILLRTIFDDTVKHGFLKVGIHLTLFPSSPLAMFPHLHSYIRCYNPSNTTIIDIRLSCVIVEMKPEEKTGNESSFDAFCFTPRDLTHPY